LSTSDARGQVDHVGPVLEASDDARAVVAAIRQSNVGVVVENAARTCASSSPVAAR